MNKLIFLGLIPVFLLLVSNINATDESLYNGENLIDDAFGQEINDSYKVPLISTVGDFNHTTGKLNTGHNPIEYNASNIPGLQIDDCPLPQKEIAIYIHGFLVNGISLGSENATEIFDRARLSLNNTGYDVTLIGFNWDSDIKNGKAWEVTKDVAKSNGLKLAQFILDFKKDCPQTDVRLIAHSLGSRIVLSSLDALNENQEWNNNNNFTIASVHLLGAAVDNEVSKDPWDIVKDATNDEAYKNINIFAMEEPITLKGVKTAFGEAIEDEVRNFSNLYSSKDDSLEWFYPMMEGNDTALGQTGAQYGISLPSNYMERDVKNNITALCDADGRGSCNFPYNIVLGSIADVGDNHFGYVGFRDTNGTLKNNGAMDVVVEDWNKQNELENKTTPDDNS
jgi:hypothetical protein